MPEAENRREEKVSPGKLKGSIWSKMTEKRGVELKARSISNIGPGEYDPRNKLGNAYPSSAFKSESIRSFFDQIYF